MLYYNDMGNKVSYTFRFDAELIEQVDKQGTKENRSRTNMIEVMIMNYLHRYDPLTREAIYAPEVLDAIRTVSGPGRPPKSKPHDDE